MSTDDTGTASTTSGTAATTSASSTQAGTSASNAETTSKELLVGKVETAVVTKAEKVGNEIEKWFVERIHNTEVAAQTAIYNVVFEAKETLKDLLGDLVEKL